MGSSVVIGGCENFGVLYGCFLLCKDNCLPVSALKCILDSAIHLILYRAEMDVA